LDRSDRVVQRTAALVCHGDAHPDLVVVGLHAARIAERGERVREAPLRQRGQSLRDQVLRVHLCLPIRRLTWLLQGNPALSDIFFLQILRLATEFSTFPLGALVSVLRCARIDRPPSHFVSRPWRSPWPNHAEESAIPFSCAIRFSRPPGVKTSPPTRCR